MKILRKFHLLVGCFFAPLLIYYSFSGIGQVMDWKHKYPPLPKDYQKMSKENQENALQKWSDERDDWVRKGKDKTIFYFISLAHTKFKGSPNNSFLYHVFSSIMAIGIISMAVSGLIMAFKCFKSRWLVSLILILGIVLPLLFFFL